MVHQMAKDPTVRAQPEGPREVRSVALALNELADAQSRARAVSRTRSSSVTLCSTARDDFVSNVSHELRTPLTTVRMAGDVLHDARADFDPVSARAAELLQVELDRFETLLSDLLEISRFDAGAAVLDLDDVNLPDVAHRVVDSTTPLADQRGVRLVVRAPDDHPCLAQADVRRVERIVRNLVTNAIDHAGPARAGGFY